MPKVIKVFVLFCLHADFIKSIQKDNAEKCMDFLRFKKNNNFTSLHAQNDQNELWWHSKLISSLSKPRNLLH